MARKDFSITIDDKALNRQIEQAIRRNPRETAKAARDCLLDLAANSAKRAPVDTGDLRNDCKAELNGTTIFAKQSAAGSGISPSLSAFGSVSYGLPYALRQHEELENSHPKGGEAKFLERPFEERKSRYEKRFERIVEDVLK